MKRFFFSAEGINAASEWKGEGCCVSTALHEALAFIRDKETLANIKALKESTVYGERIDGLFLWIEDFDDEEKNTLAKIRERIKETCSVSRVQPCFLFLIVMKFALFLRDDYYRRNDIVTVNLAGRGFLTNETLQSRYCRAFTELTKKHNRPLAICCQEVVPGSDEKYITEILNFLGRDYGCIFPENYQFGKETRSAINVIFFDRTRISEIEIHTLENEQTGFWNLYNYVCLKLEAGINLRVINVHMVSCANDNKPKWYQEERKQLSEIFWKDVLKELQRQFQDEMLLVGDLNIEPVQENRNYIELCRLLTEKGRPQNVVTYNRNGVKKHLDYVFVSDSFMDLQEYMLAYPVAKFIENKISDHDPQAIRFILKKRRKMA